MTFFPQNICPLQIYFVILRHENMNIKYNINIIKLQFQFPLLRRMPLPHTMECSPSIAGRHKEAWSSGEPLGDKTQIHS